MELLCLGGEGKGQGDGGRRRRSCGPSCHLLQASGVHFLLECPIDVSMLRHFFPAPAHPGTMMELHNDKDEHRRRKKEPSSVVQGFMHHLPSKRVKGLENEDSWKNAQGISANSCSDARKMDWHPLLDKEPWYKTPEFGLVDISCIDVVLVSNPQGMLGLPLLTARKEFSGKIYATDVTAKLGQLMMEELVSMHGEYVERFGRPWEAVKSPSWLKPPIFYTLPKKVQKAFVDGNCAGRSNWHKLYSKQDIQACMKKVQCLHYDEERSIYDRVCIKPCSSGFDLGSSNWVIRGTRCLSYFSASDLISGHAMGLNVASHISSDVLLFCDLESSSEEKRKTPKTVVDSDKGGEISEIRMCTIPEHCDELSSVGKATVDAVDSGGSVLIATSGFGALFELLEVISQALSASKLEHIPIFFIASVAEELLVYANTMPEWVCSARQEKLFAGEALFGHAELQKTKRLFPITGLHSLESVRLWKEPCVAVAMDWSLRMGANVHLLHKWRQDARCLLVLTQGLEDVEHVLLPFQPIKMKVLVYDKPRKLRGSEVAAVIEKLKPELSLLPESMESEFRGSMSSLKRICSAGKSIRWYRSWDVLTIPLPKRIEVKMSADLARDFSPKQLDSGIALGRMMMNARQKNGSWFLEVPEHSQMYTSSCSLASPCKRSIYWGSVRTKDLLAAFMERGLHCSETQDHDLGVRSADNHAQASCVTITSPSHAVVRLAKDSTLIETNDPIVCQVIVDALRNLLNFV